MFFIHCSTYYAWSAFSDSANQTLGEVETKTLISQLCQKWFCQKLLKSA